MYMHIREQNFGLFYPFKCMLKNCAHNLKGGHSFDPCIFHNHADKNVPHPMYSITDTERRLSNFRLSLSLCSVIFVFPS